MCVACTRVCVECAQVCVECIYVCLSLAHAPPTDSLVKFLVGVPDQVEVGVVVEVVVVVVVALELRRLEKGFPCRGI